MPTTTSVISDYRLLTPSEQEYVKSKLFSLPFVGKDLNSFVEDSRFFNGRVCPKCGSVHIIRDGKQSNGKQRYKCMDCKKRFGATTDSIAAYTHKELDTWKLYVECMLNKYSIRKCSSVCKISYGTAFSWRHKILDALELTFEKTSLSGIVEADETFFSVSYKGNHSKSKTFAMPRPAHKRGNSIHTRGLSREKICVPCAINHNGDSYAKVSNLAIINIAGLHATLDDHICKGSTLVTDKAKAYRKFAIANKMKLIQLKGATHIVKGLYSIQHINSFHSHLKSFMSQFNGVSSKYLNNYLIWNKLVKYNGGDIGEQRNRVLACAFSALIYETVASVRERENVPVLVP